MHLFWYLTASASLSPPLFSEPDPAMSACVAAVSGAKNFHWIGGETVLLCKCWGQVSENETGPGISQAFETLWNKITEMYLASNPPPPQDKSGRVTEEPRDKSSLYNKWNRMQPKIGCFIKCVTFAEANHASGESAEDDMKRAIDHYNGQNKKNWSMMDEYDALKTLPRWLIDRIGAKKQKDRLAGLDLNRPVQETMKRAAEESPTVANTGKPVGIKKARRNVYQDKLLLEEKEEEEAKLETFLESITMNANLNSRALDLEEEKNAELAATTDALLLFAEEIGLSQESKDILRSSKRVAKERMKDRVLLHDRRVAYAAALAAEADRLADEDARRHASEEEAIETQNGSGSLA